MTMNTWERQQRPMSTAVGEASFLQKVFLWLAAAFGASAIGTFFIGPLVPPSLMMPLYLVTLGVLLIASFTRKARKLAPIFAIAIPLIIGITLYGTLSFYVASGMGDIIVASLAATALVFGSTAVIAWISAKSLESWSGKLFGILIGVIALSLLNVFLLHVSWLSLVIACVTLVIFTIYSYIDIQRVRDHQQHSLTPAMLSLSIYLDTVNIFLSILRIFSAFR